MSKFIYSFHEINSLCDGCEALIKVVDNDERKNYMFKGRNNIQKGFTISRDACIHYFKNRDDSFLENLLKEENEAIENLENETKKKFGSSETPLIVQCRTGAKKSIPHCICTLNNVGINDSTAETLSKVAGNSINVWDSYRILIESFGVCVLGIPIEEFENLFNDIKKSGEITEETLKITTEEFKKLILEKGSEFPQNPRQIIKMYTEAAIRKWIEPSSIKYREETEFPDDIGLTINVIEKEYQFHKIEEGNNDFDDTIIDFYEIRNFLNEKQKKHIDLIDSIFNINEKNVENVFNEIEKSDENINYIFRVIEYAFKVRPFQKPPLVCLMCRLSKKHEYKPFSITKEFSLLLTRRCVMRDKEMSFPPFPNEDILFYFSDEIDNLGIQIISAIKEDDSIKFSELIKNPEFDKKESFDIDGDSAFSYVLDISPSGFSSHSDINYMQIISYFGAEKCFDIAIDNKFKAKDVANFAVAGGNLNIIKKLYNTNKAMFKDSFVTAIQFHRTDVCQWLLKTYNKFNYDLQKTQYFYNDLALFFMTKNYIPIKEKYFLIAVFSTTETANLTLLSYFLEDCKYDVNKEDLNGNTLINKAAANNQIEVLKLLIEKYNANPNKKDSKGLTALYYAANVNNLEMIKYLIENCKVEINENDIKATENEEIKKYLSSKL